MKWYLLERIVGVLTIMTGLIYLFGIYGQMETEVQMWGIVAILLGGFIVWSSNQKNKSAIRLFLLLSTIIQVPAIILWLRHNGGIISDGTPSSSFIVHWGYATPHILIVFIGVFTILFSFSKGTP
ncbi:hypothetical protein [Salirhabdus salicampi]|uniref:hypothetical protein n=1 Tax=Salirhabdus salicampi TaxID=476102 RepID=UPI0020C2E70E|nr:hypothetical protein [Salirhabdus salicampi]MCP8615958.1 hypothetical protein [Salirhabdus salicampi]